MRKPAHPIVSILLLCTAASLAAQTATNVRLDTDAPGAGASIDPQIAVSGSSIFVTWYDSRNGKNDIYFNRSTDGGRTWLNSDIRLDTDVPGAANSEAVQIAVAGSSIYVTWHDDRNGLTQDIYCNRSLDGGSTWLGADIRLDTDSPGAAVSFKPRVATSGTSVYVTWADFRNGQSDIYFNRSLDNGNTWLTSDVRLDTQAGASENVQIDASGAFVFVTWADRRNGLPDIHCNYSQDGGATWLASDFRVDTDSPGVGYSGNPKVVVSGSEVYVTWDDRRNGDYDIYFNRSLNSGRNWFSTDIRLDTDKAGDAHSWVPGIVVSGPSVYVTWTDFRGGQSDIYFNRSLDRGGNWLGSDVRVDTDTAGSFQSLHPAIAASGASVYVTWEEFRNGRADIYFNRSVDGGATWLGSDLRLDQDLPAAADSWQPQIAVSGTDVYVTWDDKRNGQSDVYFTTPCTSAPRPATNRLIGQSCKHPLYPTTVLEPRLANSAPYAGYRFELQAMPLPPSTTSYAASGLLGLQETPTPFDLSLTGLFRSSCFLYVDYLVQIPLPRTTPTATDANWLLVLPCDSRLIGFKFYAQVAILDSARPGEWMTTNAYEGMIGSR